ncbi:uncharacterized protein BO95DRAFT_444886 [Aspergillus brunneoviolaceus CBS 621.78]|uniref:Uncharacterized protein n=1 Tax=Aspergillus brunneoviolaceus CBS 621.78 TaxID=1450534 RepID=A0ACD1G393_9EURO|nr:hypothetical protein BO95DRAFT_444886 [Aspergillus brunneoviolaceus CBS 621.78]RAH43723.1 hypothetical protein BO95DRAFT_444886 [Aspergillus brunneoviolaceus CBS 621.78]
MAMHQQRPLSLSLSVCACAAHTHSISPLLFKDKKKKEKGSIAVINGTVPFASRLRSVCSALHK